MAGRGQREPISERSHLWGVGVGVGVAVGAVLDAR